MVIHTAQSKLYMCEAWQPPDTWLLLPSVSEPYPLKVRGYSGGADF